MSPGIHLPRMMKACRVERFGPPEVIEYADVERPVPREGEVLVQVRAAGVGPWDDWVRSGRSQVVRTLPVTLGSDLSGVIVECAADVEGFAVGDEVFGVTNPEFTGACAQFALVRPATLARKPARLTYVEAASVPVIATTAWQMLVDHAEVTEGDRVLIAGAAGNVGAFAVQLAKRLNATVVASVLSDGEAQAARRLGADEVLMPGQALPTVDAVIDTVGGSGQSSLLNAVRAGGVFVSSVATPDPLLARQHNVEAIFFIVAVNHYRLTQLGDLLEAGYLSTNVGTVLPLQDVRIAHETLIGLRPRSPGKIVLRVDPA